MSTKTIYFVRHGETILNAKGVRQGPDGPLTEKGRIQARETALRFPKEKGKPQVLISSPYERTKETATIIANELGMSIEYCDLLVERRNPSEIVGKSGADPEVSKIVDIMDKSFHDDNYRFSDEENFSDLKARAKKLLEYIAKRPENQIIMVTHSIFLQMVISVMMAGDDLTASKYNTLRFLNPSSNAGLTIVKLTSGWFRKKEWQVLMWDNKDQAEVDPFEIIQ